MSAGPGNGIYRVMKGLRGLGRMPFARPGARAGVITRFFGVVAIALFAYAVLVYTPARQRALREQWRDQLTLLLHDRVGAIEAWVQGRRADARAIAEYPTLQHVLRPGAPPPYPFPEDEGARPHLEDLFRRYAASHPQHGTWVLDTSGVLQASAEPQSGPLPVVRDFAAALLRGGADVQPIRRDGRTSVLFGRRVTDERDVTLGVLVLEVGADAFLSALLGTEALGAAHAEVVLASAAGGDTIFLTAGGRPDAPLERFEAGAAERSALLGQTEFRELRDRSGEPMFVVSTRLASVSWGLAAKLDRGEAIAAFRGELRQGAALVAGLLMALGGMLIALRTEHRGALERAQRESDQRVRALTENASDVIYRVRIHPEVRYEFVNAAIEQVTGYRPAEFYANPELGRSLIHPDDIALLEPPAARLPAPEPIRLRWRHRDGHTVWVEQRPIPVYDETRRLVAIEVVAREITRQHEAETALREAHERLQLALDVGGIGLFELDVPTQTATLTAGYAGRLGITDATTTVATWREAVHPDDRAAASALLENIITHGPDRYENEYRARAADGSYLWIHALGRVTARDAAGRALRIVGVHADISARRAAEAALRDSEARYRATFEQAAVGMVQATLDRTITVANDRFARMLGYQPAEVIGRRASELTHPDDGPRETELMRALIAGEIPSYAIEKRYLHRSGRIVWAEVSVVVMRTPGADAYLLAAIEDISARRSAEDALRESEERHRTLFETTTQGVVYCAADGSIVAMNPAAEEITGVTRDAASGRWPAPDWHWLDENGAPVTEADSPFRVAQRTGRAVRNAVMGIHDPRRNTFRWVLLSAQPQVRPGESTPHHVYVTLADLTPLRAAQAALEDSREMYRAIVENTHEVVVRFDRELRLLYINPACARYVPFTPAELMGRTLAELGYADAVIEKWSGIISGVFADGVPRVETFTLDLAGEPRYFSWRLFPEFDSHGRVRTVVTVATDVTETRSLEAQYQQAQKMEAVGRLAGGVAHDFNNLITAMRGYAGFLLDDLGVGDRRREDVQEIVSAADRAAALTRQLLAFSRKQVLNVDVLELGSVVQHMEKLLQRLIGADVRLVLDLAEDRAPTLADAGQMEQVVMNLALNARDAMPRGGTLTIGVRNRRITVPDARFDPRAAAGDYVELSVQDDGEGMPPQVLAHLFEPFFTTKENGKGTGLGLSTVYGIVRQSGGAIRVESALGTGTRFEVLLPRAQSRTSTAAVPGKAHEWKGAETVLVVEDEPAVRSLACRMLEGAGYRVLAAASAEEALSRALNDPAPIQLLLTDVIMPGLSGRELAREFCRMRPRSRVLYMSGYTDDVIADHGLLEPGLSLLQKPFTSATLLEGVRATLEQAASLY